jgi:hypothetical protein
VGVRRLVVATVALATTCVGVGLSVPADAGPAGAPSQVRTTIRLTGPGHYRIDATGRARAGVQMVLQGRFDGHDGWVTRKAGRATARGTFHLGLARVSDPSGSYRVCVVRPGPDACAPGGPKHIVKAHGKITVTDHATQLLPDETTFIAAGRLSKLVRHPHSALIVQSDSWTGDWSRADFAEVTFDGPRFTVRLREGAQAPGETRSMRLIYRSPYVKKVWGEWAITAFIRQPISHMSVTSGSWVLGSVVYGFVNGAPVTSAAVTPTDTFTVKVPDGCTRVQAGVSQNVGSGVPGGTWSAQVQRNGVTAYDTTTTAARTFSLDVSTGDSLTFSVSFDAAHPEQRPWFVSPYPAAATYPKLPFVLCRGF